MEAAPCLQAEVWVSSVAQSLISCVTLRSLAGLFGPQCFHLLRRNYKQCCPLHASKMSLD